MKDGGYKRLMEKFTALQQKVNCRYVNMLWNLKREDLKAKSYSLDDTYEQARIAQMTGHELVLRAENNELVCKLVRRVDA